MTAIPETRPAAGPQPDGAYSWARLALSVLLGTILCVGSWSVVVVLPSVQTAFGIDRGLASWPYTFMMIGFASGAMLMGRIVDRFGMAWPIVVAALCQGGGYVLAGLAGGVWSFAASHVFIGFGASLGFAPLIADVSHWFVRRRGLAVGLTAAGNYLAGAIWSPLIQKGLEAHGWRATHIAIGVLLVVLIMPLAPFFRRRVAQQVYASAQAASDAARLELGLSPAAVMALLSVAGFACCVAMSMPQVHLVAYCADLGYGAARGAEMLALMLTLGLISRIGSGYLADRFGGLNVLLAGSAMQALALFLYLFFDGLAALYIISGIFGLFQGGIVPMYAVIARELLPPREAGQRIGIIILATILGMAAGGLASGYIYAATSSYQMAFLNGLAWNLVNIAIISGLIAWPRLKAGRIQAA